MALQCVLIAHHVCFLAFAIVLTASAAPLAVGQITRTSVVAQVGDAPFSGPGAFADFGDPALNDAGQVAFSARLFGVGVNSSNDGGLFRSTGPGIFEIAREGQAAPVGLGGFLAPSSPVINNAGQVGFIVGLAGAGVTPATNGAIYRNDGSSVVQIAREGQPNPAGFGAFVEFGSLTLNGIGNMGFFARLGGAGVHPSNDQGLYVANGATIVPVVQEGQPTPAGPGAFAGFSPTIALNDAGQVAFLASLDGDGVTSYNNSALYRSEEVDAVQIARTGQAAPSGPGQFTRLGSFTLSDAGEVAFLATLGGEGVDSSNYEGLYRSDGSAVVPIARVGDALTAGPGSYRDLSFPTFLPMINDSGEVAFLAELGGVGVDSTNDRGLYRSDGFSTVEIARAGQKVPSGHGEFARFLFGVPTLNQNGQVAFSAGIEGDGVDSRNDEGLFLYDDRFGLLTIARTGDILLNSTITRLSFNDNHVDENNGFNSLGQVAYRFELADGNSGVAVFSVIPEPASFLIFAVCAIGLLKLR